MRKHSIKQSVLNAFSVVFILFAFAWWLPAQPSSHDYKIVHFNESDTVEDYPTFSDGLAPMRTPTGWGFIDIHGNFVIAPVYKAVSNFHDGIALVIKGSHCPEFQEYDKKWFIDKNGHRINDSLYTYVPSSQDKLYLKLVEDRVYIVDSTSQILAEPVIEIVSDFHDGMALVQKMTIKMNFNHECTYDIVSSHYVNKKGETVLTPPSKNVTDFSDGLAAVKMDGKWGFMGQNGNIVIQPRFDEIDVTTSNANSVRPFSEGMAAFSDENGKWGFMDKKGNTVVEPKYPIAFSFSEGLAFVGFNNGYKNGAPIVKEYGNTSYSLDTVSMFGCIDKQGKLVFPPKHEWELRKWEDDNLFFHNGIAMISTLKHSNWVWYSMDTRHTRYVHSGFGLIDRKGAVVKDPIFQKIWDFSEGLAPAAQNFKFSFIDSKGQVIITPDFDWAKPFSAGMAPVRLDDKWGFIDKTGKMMIEPRFAEIWDESIIQQYGEAPKNTAYFFRDKLTAFTDENSLWGYMDKTGHVVIPPKYECARPFSEGLSIAYTHEECHIINIAGEVVATLPADYMLKNYSEGLAFFTMENDSVYQLGLLDRNGKEVLQFPDTFDNCRSLHEGLGTLYSVLDYGIDRETVVDKKGKVVFTKTGYIAPYSEGLAAFRFPNGKYGYLDPKGDTAIAPTYDEAASFQEGLAAVKVGGKWGFIDTKGNMVVAPQFYEVGNFSNGVTWFLDAELDKDYSLDHDMNGDEYKKLYYNKKGEIAFSLPYDTVCPFSEGLAAVLVNGKWGFVNTDGKMVIAPQYDEDALGHTPSFHDGMCPINMSGKHGYIDKTGKIVIEPQYDQAWGFSNGLAKVMVNQKVGFIDKNGKMVIAPKYDYDLDIDF